MSIEENKAIARRFIQVWGKGSLDIIDELADPSLSVQYPIISHMIRDSKMFKQIMESFRSAFPDSDIQIEEEIAEGDKVVIRWNLGSLRQIGVAPQG